MLSVHVELHHALEEILSLLGGRQLTHLAVQELLLVLDYELVALYNRGADVKGPELGPDFSYLRKQGEVREFLAYSV